MVQSSGKKKKEKKKQQPLKDAAAPAKVDNKDLPAVSKLQKNQVAKERTNVTEAATCEDKRDDGNKKRCMVKITREATCNYKDSFQTELDHNLDLLDGAKNHVESAETFNENTIMCVDVGDVLNNNKTRYVCISKLGDGSFALVWLVFELQSKCFKAAKIFRYGENLEKAELKVLNQTKHHPNILHFDESFKYPGNLHRHAFIAIFEPLGKDVSYLMYEANKINGGRLHVSVIKKMTKDVLMALVTLHDAFKIIHADIKPNNIATCITQKSLYLHVEKIVNSSESLLPLRMTCQKDVKFDEEKTRGLLKDYLKTPPPADDEDESNDFLKFKLIDLGNALGTAEQRKSGTYSFRPPEYCFGAPLIYSHDLWSLGVTIINVLTFQDFLPPRNPIRYNENEIEELGKIFGKFPRNLYYTYPDQFGLQEKFTTAEPLKLDKEVKKVLKTKIEKCHLTKSERKDILEFLFNMLHIDPAKRMKAKDLLKLKWFKNVD